MRDRDCPRIMPHRCGEETCIRRTSWQLAPGAGMSELMPVCAVKRDPPSTRRGIPDVSMSSYRHQHDDVVNWAAGTFRVGIHPCPRTGIAIGNRSTRAAIVAYQPIAAAPGQIELARPQIN